MPPSVATVNGVNLTRPEFDIYEKNLLRKAKVQSLTPDQKNQVLDDLITMQTHGRARPRRTACENEPDIKAQPCTAAHAGAWRMRSRRSS